MRSQICQSCKLEIDSTSLFTCPSCGKAYHSICWHNNNYQCLAPDCTGIVHNRIISEPNKSKINKWTIIILTIITGGLCVICLLGLVIGYLIFIKKISIKDLNLPLGLNQSQSVTINQRPDGLIIPKSSQDGTEDKVNPTINDMPKITPTISPTQNKAPLRPANSQSISLTPVAKLELKGYECPDKDLIKLRSGIEGIVGGIDINLREAPKVPEQWNANIIGVLKKGDRVKVLDGPVCAHDGSWWYVSTQSNEQGWTREMLPDKGYLITPINN
jgi:hypothetical protein